MESYSASRTVLIRYDPDVWFRQWLPINITVDGQTILEIQPLRQRLRSPQKFLLTLAELNDERKTKGVTTSGSLPYLLQAGGFQSVKTLNT